MCKQLTVRLEHKQKQAEASSKTVIKQLATKKCKRCTYRKKVIKKCPNAEVKAP